MSIEQAFTSETVLEAAMELSNLGVSVVPVVGKVCPIPWKRYQREIAPVSKIYDWHAVGILRGVAVVLGAVSGNLTVVDLDGEQAVKDFYDAFPHYADTLTVLSGSRRGRHLYFYSFREMKTTICDGIELRSTGAYVVAPPSVHPSGLSYEVIVRDEPITLPDIDDVAMWIQQRRGGNTPPPAAPVVPINPRRPDGSNPAWVATAVNRQLADVRTTQTDVNNKLNAAAYSLGRIAGNPNSGLDTNELVSLLADAASHLTARDGYNATIRTINSGLKAGMNNPVKIPKVR